MDLDRQKELTQKAENFFIECNKILSEIYDDILESVPNEEILAHPDFQKNVENLLANGMTGCFADPLDGLGGLSGEEFIDSLQSLEEVLLVLKIAFAKVDHQVPDILLFKLKDYSQTALPELLKMAWQADWEYVEPLKRGQEGAAIEPLVEGLDSVSLGVQNFRESLLVSMGALNILGQWQEESAISTCLEKLYVLDKIDEFLAEKIKDYLSRYETGVTKALANFWDLKRADIENQWTWEGWDYFFIYLTEAAIREECKSEEVYQILREGFRKSSRKVISAICLGDYGEPKGIVVLKGYLERNLQEIDQQLYYEIIDSVRRLGGDIKDIPRLFAK